MRTVLIFLQLLIFYPLSITPAIFSSMIFKLFVLFYHFKFIWCVFHAISIWICFAFWILLSCLLSLEHTWYPMQQLQSVGQCLGSCINIVLFFYYCFMYIDYVLKINQYIMCFISYHLSVCYKFYYKIIVSIYLSFYQNIGLDFYSIIKKEEKNTLLLI